MIGVVTIETGALALYPDDLWQQVAPHMDMAGQELVDVPPGYPETLGWTGTGFEPYPPPPVLMTGLQVLALYRPAQHARAKRMLFATYPEGHPQAGELVDPDGFTERLVDATLASSAIVLGGTEHIQGTTWMRAIGVIESDEEAARILAGITPEEAA